jgi:hypothetical protein
MRFTVEQAFEASEDQDPIMLAIGDIKNICDEHDLALSAFYDAIDCGKDMLAIPCDAAHLFGWLGY